MEGIGQRIFSGGVEEGRVGNYHRRSDVNAVGSDFVEMVCAGTRNCSECHKKIFKGKKLLAAKTKDGTILKYVCSEDCRLEFDNRFWQERARRRGHYQS